MNPHLLPSFFPPLRVALAVEELSHTIVRQENLSWSELSRCRYEVMLQLGYSCPWTDGLNALERPPSRAAATTICHEGTPGPLTAHSSS